MECENLSSDWRLSLSMFALVPWWIGSDGLLWPTAVRFLLFPYAFCSCQSHFLNVSSIPQPVPTTPIDSGVGNSLPSRSRPRNTRGIILSIPALDIEVARECSSIRSSTMLIVITLILAHLFLRSSWRNIASCGGDSVIGCKKCGAHIHDRGTRDARRPRIPERRLHHNGGIVFLGLAVFVDVALLWILRRGEYRT